MRRQIEFNSGDAERDQRRFMCLYAAMLQGGQNPGQRFQDGAVMDTLRREGRILDALETISTAREGALDRDLRPRQRLTLEQPDYELLRTRVDKTAWMPSMARIAVDAFDWLSTAKEIDDPVGVTKSSKTK